MKFSVITPVYNGEKYIEETIQSVLSQEGNFEIEYIIQDGGSNDGTLEIINKYDLLLKRNTYPLRCRKITFSLISEKDTGLCDALEKGFARATGDICSFINADDFYSPQAFFFASQVFEKYKDIQWIKGITDFLVMKKEPREKEKGTGYLYNQEWIRKGVYGRNAYFIHSDSIFWKRSLWEKVHPRISHLSLACDYALWVSFAQYAPLWTINKHVSVFRKRPGQLSENMEKYHEEQDVIMPRGFFIEKKLSVFFTLGRILKIQAKDPLSKILFFLFFPFHKERWYIDFDRGGNPLKVKTNTYLI